MLFVKDYLADQRVLRSESAPASPLVSVVLPTYARHASGRLRRAVESVLAQTFADFELIVVDDGSTDGTYDFVAGCRARDPRVVHVRHESNSGLPAVRVNEGIELARGRFVAFQFDDDTWLPGALAALFARAERHTEPAVVVGRCRATRGGERVVYPNRALELPYLYERNDLANNSVLVPRAAFDLYGMYDCHVGLRRNCDWDLWLRLIKHLPFVLADEFVSEVEAGLSDSMGETTPYDVSLVRLFHSARRGHLLTPSRWRDYEVDALRAGEVEIEGEIGRRLYEEQVVPYYLRHRHRFTQVEGFPSSLPARRRTALYTKEEYDDPLYEILKSHDEAFARRGSYSVRYEPQAQVGPGWVKEADLLLLVRSFQANATNLLAQARAADLPVGYFLDDDFLTLHESGEEFRFLAPGEPQRERLEAMLTEADAVWVTSRSIEDSVRRLTPRTVPYNGSVARDSLPAGVRPREAGRPLRVACTSGGYRREELRHLWDALLRFSREYGDRVVFEFWGVDVEGLPPLASPVVRRPFSRSYPLYLRRLREAGFDVTIAPLLGHTTARRGKSPNKYYLAAVAGALGIFSDVQPYEMLPGGLTCLKAENTADAWYAALCEAAEMPAPEFDLMRLRMLEHVREEFTEAAELDTHEAALRATEFHARTRRARRADGRPRVLLYRPPLATKGDEGAFRRRVELMRGYGVEPLVVFDKSSLKAGGADTLARMGVETDAVADASGGELRELFERHAPALVHSFAFAPALGMLCVELGVPHVASPRDIEESLLLESNFRYCDVCESDSLHAAERLRRLFGAERFCVRGPAARELFDLGVRRRLESLGRETGRPAGEPARVISLRTSAGTSGADEALDSLTLSGFDCRLRIFAEEDADASVFQRADVLLNVPDGGDGPTRAVEAAMAAGVLVVTPPAPGVEELIIDGVSGILCVGDSAEELADGLARALRLTDAGREELVERARRVARSEFHPGRAANDLFSAYNRALELAPPARAGGESSSESLVAASCSLGVQPLRPAWGHVQVTDGLKFVLVPRRENWIGLDVLVGTHQRSANGSLRLRVSSLSGALLRETSEELSAVSDNDWVSFRFDAIRDAARGPLIAEFALDTRDRGTRVSLYESSPPEGRARRLLRRAGVRGLRDSLHCRMWYAG